MTVTATSKVHDFALSLVYIKAELPLAFPVCRESRSLLRDCFIHEVNLPKYFSVICIHVIKDSTTSGISLIKQTNRIGPRTESCGTPLRTSISVEKVPAIATRCLRPVRKCRIHCRTGLPISYDASFTSSLSWGTESKALAKSKYTESIAPPWSNISGQKSITYIKAKLYKTFHGQSCVVVCLTRICSKAYDPNKQASKRTP